MAEHKDASMKSYLGLYDPRRYLGNATQGRPNFHGIHAAARSIARCVTSCGGFDEYVFVAPQRREADNAGHHVIPWHAVPEWLRTRDQVCAHDLAIGELWFNRCRHLFAQRACPIVFTLHSMSYGRTFGATLGEALRSPMYAFDRAVVPSRAGADAFGRILDRLWSTPGARGGPAISVVPIPVDTEWYAPGDRRAARETLGIPLDVPVFLYVGRLNPADKADLHPLLLAVQRIRQLRPALAFHVLVAGWEYVGYDRWILGTAASLGIGDRVSVHPTPDGDRLRALYHAADVFLALGDSVQETYGVALAEAMSCGLPAIATAWSGHKELVRSGCEGILVDTMWARCDSVANRFASWQSDHYYVHQLLARQVACPPSAIAAAMIKLAEGEGLRARLGGAARARAIERLSMKVAASGYRELFDRALSQAANASWTANLAAMHDAYAVSYFDEFQTFPSRLLDDELTIELADRGSSLAYEAGVSWDPQAVGVSPEVVDEVAELLTQPRRIADIRRCFGPNDSEEVTRAILLGLKYGRFDLPALSCNGGSRSGLTVTADGANIGECGAGDSSC
jgi:glycosyltransferase involved in cell wall biosynthesis